MSQGLHVTSFTVLSPPNGLKPHKIITLFSHPQRVEVLLLIFIQHYHLSKRTIDLILLTTCRIQQYLGDLHIRENSLKHPHGSFIILQDRAKHFIVAQPLVISIFYIHIFPLLI